MVRNDFLVLLSQQLLLSVERVCFYNGDAFTRCIPVLGLPPWEGMSLLWETRSFNIGSFVNSKPDPNLVLPKPVGSLWELWL